VKWADTGLKLKQGEKEVPRGVTLGGPQWSDDGSKLVFPARSEDFKDRWIFAADPATGALRSIFHLHDDAWVGGPGGSILGWLPDNERVFFVAERDGWAHLHTTTFGNGEVKQLTSGQWEVESAVLSRDKRSFWLVTGEQSLFERQIYSMAVEGGARTRITLEPGNHEPAFSRDDSMAAVVHSYANKPPELYLMKPKPGAAMRRVTTSPAPEFASYPWLDAPILQLPARDGAKVPVRLYKPKNWKRGGPAVIFVHGAGYLQNVHKWWSTYSREYMFHHLLMERGYVVIDIDYRASAGYGRDWRTAIYRHMGGKDLDDQVDAARWLVSEYGVNPRKIGIYGGSYGGFITLMALFTQPDVFAAGAALRPVTDWAHYNHGYTGGILNTPQSDLEAYKKSSPIYHAAGLKGALLICHGMVDVNVHFQDTVRLVQKLIELRKENWEAAMYPVEDHAFADPVSWSDEYKRILKLFETNLK
jgi:dipeptidyl aminopeptidase/acylaminoacyl peptidase